VSAQQTRKRPSASINTDRSWCARHLARGTPVWCVRRKVGGLVVAYVAEDVAGFTQFDGEEVYAFTVQRMYMKDGLARFGPECAWPRMR
jgi:hypothetical protein